MVVSVKLFSRLLALACCGLWMGLLDAQTPPPPPRQEQTQTGQQQQEEARPAPPARRAGDPKPYEEVVTKEAVTQDGVFKVHRVEGKVLWEIPKPMLGRDFLWSTEVASLPTNRGYGGLFIGDRIVRFSRRENKIFLHIVDHSNRAYRGEGGMSLSVELANRPPIVQAWNVEAEGPEGTAVIDVTSYFLSDPADFAARGRLGAGGVDSNRSWIEEVLAFPTNIETRSTITFVGGQGGPSTGPTGGIFGTSRPSASTALMHYSLVLLPKEPMRGRLFDDRVGYFSAGFSLYGSPRNRVENLSYITRFRLEKKDPLAEVSEPVKPIVFYISREVPEVWRKWLKKGVEDWQPAFEQAGFKNAILAKDAPTVEEDPTWHPEDARYNVIRWAAQPVQNAMGPHIHDPRSGEIVSAHIIFWHDILKLLENWYFVQVAHMDPRAQRLPIPEELMGELVRYVSAHEVGHTLGLQHNFRSSSNYTIAQLRDTEFTEKYGIAASIMDYARFNYVAQPGDRVRLWSILGPYDKFAIEWGYKVFPQALSSEGEKFYLDQIAARQVTNPMLRFGNFPGIDPMSQTESLGDDPIEATRLGLLNLERIMRLLIPATTQFGEDYSRLSEMYGMLIGQKRTELGHVVANVGGMIETNFHAGRGGPLFNLVPKARQRESVQFLHRHAFRLNRAFVPNDILDRIEPGGVTGRVLNLQRGLLAALLAEGRIARMYDQQARYGVRAYMPVELLADVTDGIWEELDQANPTIDIYRRNLQRAYLELADSRLNGGARTTTELAVIWPEALQRLKARIDSRTTRATDPTVRAHLAAASRRIADILDPKVAPGGGGGAPVIIFPFVTDPDDPHLHDCFGPHHLMRAHAH